MEPRERLTTVLSEIKTLNDKGVLEKNDALRMAELITEGKGLRSQIEAKGQSDELESWARTSSGVPSLAAAGATVDSVKPAGATTVDVHTSGALRLADEYGEGVIPDSLRSKISGDDYHKAFKQYLRTGMGQSVSGAAMRTLQEGLDTEGGYLVPEDLQNRIIAKLPTPTRVAGMVTQLPTSRDALVIPRVNYSSATDDSTGNLYTTGIRVTSTGEIPSSSTVMRVTDPVFGQTRIPVYTYMLSIPLTNDMIEDSAFPLVSYITDKFGETVELLRDNQILNGNGQGNPGGILLSPGGTNQPTVVKSGSASTVTATGLINTAMSLPEQYDENACWVFNKTSTGKTIAGLVDGQQRPLWGTGLMDAGLTQGYNDRALIGYPVKFSGFMPNIGSSTYPAVFGDFSGYYLVNRIGFSIQVLRELYAETNQILILGRLRFGGELVEPWKLLIHQCSS